MHILHFNLKSIENSIIYREFVWKNVGMKEAFDKKLIPRLLALWVNPNTYEYMKTKRNIYQFVLTFISNISRYICVISKPHRT